MTASAYDLVLGEIPPAVVSVVFLLLFFLYILICQPSSGVALLASPRTGVGPGNASAVEPLAGAVTGTDTGATNGTATGTVTGAARGAVAGAANGAATGFVAGTPGLSL